MSPIAQDKSQQTQWENEFEERDVKVFIFESESEQRRKQNEWAPQNNSMDQAGRRPDNREPICRVQFKCFTYGVCSPPSSFSSIFSWYAGSVTGGKSFSIVSLGREAGLAFFSV